MNLDFIWSNANQRGDLSVIAPGRMSTGNLLVSAVLISLFTDRVIQPDYVPADGDPRGWWHDTFEGVPIGSRLWQLRRRKIANRQLLINEATDMLNEALQWMIDAGLVDSTTIAVTLAAADGVRNSGNLLRFRVALNKAPAPPVYVSALWSAV